MKIHKSHSNQSSVQLIFNRFFVYYFSSETLRDIRAEANAQTGKFQDRGKEFQNWLKGIKEPTLAKLDVKKQADDERKAMDEIFRNTVRNILVSNRVPGESSKRQIPENEEEYDLALKGLREARDQAKKEITEAESEYQAKKDLVGSALEYSENLANTLAHARGSVLVKHSIFADIYAIDPKTVTMDKILQAKSDLTGLSFNSLDDHATALQRILNQCQELKRQPYGADLKIVQALETEATEGLKSLELSKQQLKASFATAWEMVDGLTSMAKANLKAKTNPHDIEIAQQYAQAMSQIKLAKEQGEKALTPSLLKPKDEVQENPI